MRSRLLLLGMGLVCAATIAACTGDDAVVVSSPPGNDASAADGAIGDGGPTAGSVNLQGDFEKSGCFGWSSNEATMTLDPAAHGGSSACRVCATGTTSVWGIFQEVKSVPPGGYLGRGFVQASGDAGPPSVVMRLQAITGTDFGMEHDGQQNLLDGVPYAEVKTEIELVAGQGVGVAILGQSPGGCFLVDDVTLTKR
jgi:hypothetical protein